MDNLPQLPQLGFEKLGQRKPNKHAMPQLPQPAPTVFNMNQMEKRLRGVCEMAGRELNSRHKKAGHPRSALQVNALLHTRICSYGNPRSTVG